MSRRATLVVLLLLALGACGKVGPLQLPPEDPPEVEDTP